MKRLKRWLAFFMTVTLLLGIAYNNRTLIASQTLIAGQTEDSGKEAVTAQTGTELTKEGVTVEEDTTTDKTTAEISETAAATSPVAVTETPAAVSETPAVAPEAPAAVSETPAVVPEASAASDNSSAAPAVSTIRLLTYENENIIVTVTADADGIIPADSSLRVITITADNANTVNQYAAVDAKVQEKAASSDRGVAGFLAYDISFVDGAGNELEPNGEVSVSLNYKEAALPEGVSAEDVQNTEVKVLHLEEDSGGTVQNVTDLNENSRLTDLQITDEKKVANTSFKADSFSIYTVTWTYGSKVTFKAVYGYDNNGTFTPFTESQLASGLISVTSGNPMTLTNVTGAQNAQLGLTTISGYEFDHASVGSSAPVTNILYLRNNSGTLQYSNDNSSWTSVSGSNVYMVYRPTHVDQVSETSGSVKLGEPDHNKYIKYNSDGTYTLTLDVTGNVSTANTINIALIVDLSSSMKNNGRLTAVNNSINALKTQLASAVEASGNTLKINIAMTTFNQIGSRQQTSATSYAKIHSDYCDNWTSLENFYFTAFNTSDCATGTNWSIGFKNADTLLADKTTAGNTNYAIFLTDGNPTCWTNDNGAATSVSDVLASYNHALEAWSGTSYLRDTTTYVVQADGSANYCDDLVAYANKLKTNVASLVIGTDNASLQTAFVGIAAGIAPDKYTNVSITDTLSAYVDFQSGFTENDVTVYTVTKNGDNTETETALAATQYSVTIDTSAGKVTVQLLGGAALSASTTYRMKFKVIPSAMAYNEYFTTGYNAVGDDGTDAWNNSPATSSLLPGFYSNDKNNTYVTYTTTAVTNQTTIFKMPVIQVKLDSVTRTARKEWVTYADNQQLSSVKVKISAVADVNGAVTDVTDSTKCLDTGRTALSNLAEQTLDENGGWMYTWENLPEYYYYEVTGTGGTTYSRSEITYSFTEELSDEEKALYDTTYATESGTTTITNTRKSELTVVKQWSDSKDHSADSILVGLYNDNSAVTSRYLTLNQDNQWTGSFEITGSLEKYSIKELKEVKSGDSFEYTIDGKRYIGVSDKSLTTVNSTQYQASYASVVSTANKAVTVTITNAPVLNRLIITKVDYADTNTKLKGAEFKLKTKNTDGTYTYVSENAVTTDANGQVVFNDLADGVYYLEEVKAPAGYTLLKDPVEITVSSAGKTAGLVSGKYYYSTEKNVADTQIYQLPSSGGMGTYPFTIIGVALLMTALLLYKRISERRKL